MAARTRRRCSASTCGYRSRSALTSRVEPSMSLNKNVTAPPGSPLMRPPHRRSHRADPGRQHPAATLASPRARPQPSRHPPQATRAGSCAAASHTPSANRPARRATLPGQPGLPPTARPGHRHQPVVLQQPRDLAHRPGPARQNSSAQPGSHARHPLLWPVHTTPRPYHKHRRRSAYSQPYTNAPMTSTPTACHPRQCPRHTARSMTPRNRESARHPSMQVPTQGPHGVGVPLSYRDAGGVTPSNRGY